MIITSLQDDSVGGDTNANGASSGMPGDWGGVSVNGNANVDHLISRFGFGFNLTPTTMASIQNSSFEWSGWCGIMATSGTPATITNCSFSDTVGPGILVMSYPTTGLTVSGCTFDRNQVPIRFERNSFANLSGLTVHENHSQYNGVYMDTASSWDQGGTLTNAGCPYVFASDPNFACGAKLTLQAGAVVKVGNVMLQACDLDILGTESQPVIITSLQDDSVGGDTNANGASSGIPGDWGGVGFTGSAGTFQNCQIRYAFSGFQHSGSAPIIVDSFDIRHCSFGLTFSPGGGGVVRNSTIVDNTTGVSAWGPPLPILGDLGSPGTGDDGNNQFVCNQRHIENMDTSTLLAENNWWGEAPPDPTVFQGPVDIEPFLGSETDPVIPGLKCVLANGGADIVLTWGNAAPACGYRVERSEDPQSGFMDISGHLTVGQHTDAGAGNLGGNFYYQVVIEQ